MVDWVALFAEMDKPVPPDEDWTDASFHKSEFEQQINRCGTFRHRVRYRRKGHLVQEGMELHWRYNAPEDWENGPAPDMLSPP